MDRLQQNEQLNVNDRLDSINGLFHLILQGDGNLVLYRTHFGKPLWASNTDGSPADRIMMQADGNFVSYSAAGNYIWDTGTNGNPGAWIVLQDDGNLVIYDNASQPLWATNTLQNLLLPTYGYSEGGYSFVEVSENWKQMCSILPCFDALQWPGYASIHLEENINGEPVVIQLWKGWCQKFLGLQSFPGGVGAEVGVYRRILGKIRPTALPFLPRALEVFFLNALASLSDEEIWWPVPATFNTTITFNLINPITNQTFFSAGPENSYWLAKWMNDPSYIQYQADQGIGMAPTHFGAVDYILEFTINGRQFTKWPGAPLHWSEKDFGTIMTSDHDIINYRIEKNAVDIQEVHFVLELGNGITWWKAINMPDGGGSDWDIECQDGIRTAGNGLWADQVRNGQSLTFKKAKEFGRHQTNNEGYKLSNLEHLLPGSRVVFTWIQD
jgi:hypothetical protein